MAPKFIRSLLIVTLMLTALLVLPATPVRAEGLTPVEPAFPALGTFTSWLNNGQANQLRGVYVPNLIADSVVQQPADQGTFVSPRQNILTQFNMTASLGSTGLLAHNFLAGEKFSMMQYGQIVYLVYGDGRTATYMITHVLRYQALQPNSPYSNFLDLSSGNKLSSSDLFSTAYGRSGSVVFQTCIASDGLSTWGRLFVVAEPYVQLSAALPANAQ